MRDLGLFDSRAGMVVFYSAHVVPAGLRDPARVPHRAPAQLEEAAALDGARYFQLMRHIVLPLARPGLATAGVIIFINIWNDFLFNLLLAPSSEHAERAGRARPVPRRSSTTDIAAILAGTTVDDDRSRSSSSCSSSAR